MQLAKLTSKKLHISNELKQIGGSIIYYANVLFAKEKNSIRQSCQSLQIINLYSTQENLLATTIVAFFSSKNSHWIFICCIDGNSLL